MTEEFSSLNDSIEKREADIQLTETTIMVKQTFVIRFQGAQFAASKFSNRW